MHSLFLTAKGIAEEKIVVIPNGIEPEAFTSDPDFPYFMVIT